MIWPPGNTMPDGWFQPSGTDAAWIATNSAYYNPNGNNSEGTYSLRSGTITHGQVTSVQTPSLNCTAGNITFVYMMESEYGYDNFNFYIDDVLVLGRSGFWWWNDEDPSFAVSAGYHVFKWEYTKDGSGSNGADAVWIDNVSIPIDNSTTVNATGSESDFGYTDFQIVQADDALVRVDGSEIVSAFGTSIGGATGEATSSSGEIDFGWQDLLGTVADGAIIPVLGGQESFSDNSAGVSITVAIDVTGSQSDFAFGTSSATGQGRVTVTGSQSTYGRGVVSIYGGTNARVNLEGFQETFGSDSSIGAVAVDVTVTGAEIDSQNGSISTVADNVTVNFESDGNLTLNYTGPTSVSGYDNPTGCAWDAATKTGGMVLSEINIRTTLTYPAAAGAISGNLGRTTGKWYFEVKNLLGLTPSEPRQVWVGIKETTTGRYYRSEQVSGYYFHNIYGYDYSIYDGTVWKEVDYGTRFAWDADAGNLWIGFFLETGNTSWIGGGDPATGSSPTFTDVFGTFKPELIFQSLNPFETTTKSYRAQFNRELFSITAPTGFTGWGDVPTVSTNATGYEIDFDYTSPAPSVDGQFTISTGYEIDTGFGLFGVVGNSGLIQVEGSEVDFGFEPIVSARGDTAISITGKQISFYSGAVQASGDAVGWPNSDSLPSGWTTDSGGNAWTVSSTVFYEGSRSLKSGFNTGGYGTASRVYSPTIVCAVASKVKFRVKLDVTDPGSSNVASYLALVIDSVQVNSYDKSLFEWDEIQYPLAVGSHTVQFKFISGSPGYSTDRVYIDSFEVVANTDPVRVLNTWTPRAAPTLDFIQTPGTNTAWTNEPYLGFIDGTYGIGNTLVSGPVTTGQTSGIQTASYNMRSGNITFRLKVRSNDISGYGYNWLRFYIDNVQAGAWSGVKDWLYVSIPVTAGNHVLKWVYSKESENSNGSWGDSTGYYFVTIPKDCAMIDNIYIPDAYGSSDDNWPYHNSIPSYYEQIYNPTFTTRYWEVDTQRSYSGASSLISGDILSGLSSSPLFCTPGTVSFRYKAEISYPVYFRFKIIGPLTTLEFALDAHDLNGSTWEHFTHDIDSIGTYEFVWEMFSAGSSAEYCFGWIDSVLLPGAFTVENSHTAPYRLITDKDHENVLKFLVASPFENAARILTFSDNDHRALYDINDLVLQAHTSAYKHAQSAAHAAHVLHTVPSAAFLVGAYNVENTVQCAHSAQYEAPLQIAHLSSSDFSHQISSAHNALSGVLQKIIKPHTTHSPTISSIKAQQIWISDHDSDLKVQVGFTFVYHVVQPPVLAPFVVELTKT